MSCGALWLFKLRALVSGTQVGLCEPKTTVQVTNLNASEAEKVPE